MSESHTSESTAPLTFVDLAGRSVDVLKGVGPKASNGLAQVGVVSVLDLLLYYPRRWIDRTKEARIADLAVGEEGAVLVAVVSCESRRTRNRRTMVTAVVSDGSGRLALTFFNQPWRTRQLEAGMQAVVFGKLEMYRGGKQMTNPIVDLVGDRTGRIVPVYPQSEKSGVSTWEIAGWIESALNRCRSRGISDPVPQAIRDRWQLIDRESALRRIHLPEEFVQRQAARDRLVFDELLRVQIELVRRKVRFERESSGVVHNLTGELVDRFEGSLPFALTSAQRRSMDEIDADLADAQPMHRLLQGDVGSGKTLVALHALLVAIQGGHQAALMAPTEVLAEQHYLGIRALVADLEVPEKSDLFGKLRVGLLTNRVTGSARASVLADLAAGELDLLIGTHALIEDPVRFHSLGVVVIDEQHRFGVEQRAALRDKGPDGAVPDVLVMTATPIPRTAAMTVYGDLDVSVLDELPPGRTPISTAWARTSEQVDDVWEVVRSEIDAGRQVYVVCPLVEESEKLEVASAEEVYEQLALTELNGRRVALLHGRMKSTDKEATMAAFRQGETDALVATTVIEVGVDVPNATVMVIIDADRFGIAQLHQLRGRVGRGVHASRCFLIADPATEDGETRLAAIVDSTDGFALAEIDLELRGEGTLMGARQKGQNDLRLASLRRDREWVERAREAAMEIVGDDPDLTQFPELSAELALLLREEEGEFLLKD